VSKGDYKEYFHYLSTRSHLGFLYRHYYLYPHLTKFLRGKALDVGCGIGDFLNFRRNTVGLDVNPYNIEYCRKQGLNTYLIDQKHYPFPDAHFDSAIMDNVLEHIDEPENVLTEVYRVLKPNGILVVGVPGQRGYASDPGHKRFYSEENLITCITSMGFRVMRIIHMPWKSSWLDRIMRQYCIYGAFMRDNS
jgi:SAM-dependent methyltransferase